MTLKQNELSVPEKQTKKSLVSRVGSWYAKLGAGATVAVVGSSANAADPLTLNFEWIETIKSGFQSAFDGLQSIYGIAILVVLAIVVFGVMKGGTRKAG